MSDRSVTILPPGPHRPEGFIVALAMVYPTVLTWVYFVLLTDHPRAVQQGAYGVGKAVQFLLPVACLMLTERSWPRWERPSGQGIPGGLVFGVAVTLGLFLVYGGLLQPLGLAEQMGDQVVRKVEGFVGDSWLAYLALAIFYSLAHSWLEEYYWRWFVFGRLRRRYRVGAAAVISSAGFMAHHVVILAMFLGWDSPLTCIGALAVGVGGLYWAWLFQRTGALHVPWLSHLVVDAGIFALGWRILQQAG